MSRKTREQTSTHTSFVVAYTNSTGFDEAHLRLSPYDHWLACSSHTDESESKPSYALQRIFYSRCPSSCSLPYFQASVPAQNMPACILFEAKLPTMKATQLRMCAIDFFNYGSISVWFLKKLRFGLVRFCSKNAVRFGYYSYLLLM